MNKKVRRTLQIEIMMTGSTPYSGYPRKISALDILDGWELQIDPLELGGDLKPETGDRGDIEGEFVHWSAAGPWSDEATGSVYVETPILTE